MLMSRFRLCVWASSLILACVALGCGDGDGDGDGDVSAPAIRIGVLDNLDGAAGRPTREAAELAVNAVNAAGGLEVDGLKRRVELLFEDTETVPGRAIDGARRLVQNKVVAILGPGRSREAIAAAGVAENARIPMISGASTHPDTTAGKRYVFRMSFTDGFQGEALGRFAFDKLGAGSAAVLYDAASAYNRYLATAFREAFEAAGGTVVAFEIYTTGESDFRPQLEAIRDADPQVLFLPNYDEEVPLQAQQARDLGIESTLLGGESWSLIDFAGTPQLEGAFFGRHWHRDEAESRPAARRFLEAYRQAYERDPTDQAALTFDAIHLMFHALGRAGDDPDKIQRALAELEGYEGATGLMSYRDHGGDPSKRMIIVQVQGDQTVKYEELMP